MRFSVCIPKTIGSVRRDRKYGPLVLTAENHPKLRLQRWIGAIPKPVRQRRQGSLEKAKFRKRPVADIPPTWHARLKEQKKGAMRIPIRNKGKVPLTVIVELKCDQFEVPVGGEAIVRLADGRPHSIDVERDCVTIWDEGGGGSVEIISSSDKRVDEALSLARIWLHRMGADAEALHLWGTVETLEPAIGYLASRDRVFKAFYSGFAGQDMSSSEDETILACWRIGITAARLNEAARRPQTFPDLDFAPFDTDTARTAFNRALGNES
jgi:hypothetical protein